MKNKGVLFSLIIVSLCTLVGPLAAEQITKVAVIDLSRIFSVYYIESKEMRQMEEMKVSFQEEIEAIKEEIQQLEEQKLSAQNRDDEEMALRIDDEIFRKKQYLQNYIRVKNNQLQEMQRSLTQDETFLEDVLTEISNVAESDGYSAVFRTSDPNLYWWSQEIDITDKVIGRLMQKASSR